MTAGSEGHRATPLGTGPDGTGPYGASGCALLLREFISHPGDERSETRALRGSGELSNRGPFSDCVDCAGSSSLVIFQDDRVRHILTMMIWILITHIMTESMELMRVYSQIEQTASDFIRTELEMMRDHCHIDMESMRDCCQIEMVLMRDYSQIDLELLRDCMADYHRASVHLEIHSERVLCNVFTFSDCAVIVQTGYHWYRLASWTWIWAWIGWAQSDII